MGNSAFPTSLDTATTMPDPLSSTTQDGNGGANQYLEHHWQHSIENDAIIALETKVGINGSQDVTSNYPAANDVRLSLLENADYTITRPFGVLDDEFNSGSLNAKWTWLNQSTATESISRGALQISVPSGHTGDSLNALIQSVPGASTWTFEAKVGLTNNGTGICAGGLVLYESATGKITFFEWLIDAGAVSIQGTHWSSGTTYGGSTSFSAYNLAAGYAPKYMRIAKTATQYVYSLSFDGFGFWPCGSESITNYFTTSADHIGVCGDAYNITSGIPGIVSFDYFRQLA